MAPRLSCQWHATVFVLQRSLNVSPTRLSHLPTFKHLEFCASSISLPISVIPSFSLQPSGLRLSSLRRFRRAYQKSKLRRHGWRDDACWHENAGSKTRQKMKMKYDVQVGKNYVVILSKTTQVTQVLSFHQSPGLKELTLPECKDFQGWTFLLGAKRDNWVPWVSTKFVNACWMHMHAFWVHSVCSCHHLASDQMMMTVEGSEPAQNVAEPSCNWSLVVCKAFKRKMSRSD